MTREAVVKVVQRAISDGAFRAQLTKDATTALRGFDLTPAEVAAIKSGDSGRITSLGVDLRMSKAFTLAATDGRTDGVLTTGTDSSLGQSVNSTLTAGDPAMASTVNSGNSVLTSGTDGTSASNVDSTMTAGGGASVNSVDTIDAGSTANAGESFGENAGHQVVQWDGNDDAPLSTIIANEPAHSFGAQTPEGGAFGANSLTAGDEGYLPSIGYASTEEGGTQANSAGFASDEGQLTNSLNAGVGEGGAASAADPTDGPNITP